MTDTRSQEAAPAAIQAELQCPNCAGQCRYAPGAESLRCDSCGEIHAIEIDPDIDPSEEFHYHPDMPHTEQRHFTGDETYQCQTCGGQVVFTGPSLSERCAYCDGPIVRAEPDQSYDTLGMVPFAVTDDAARAAARQWVASRRATPNDLLKTTEDGRFAPIYVPFWTFDSKEAIDYMVKYRVKSGKRWVTRTMTGFMKTGFDDMLVPASPHVTPLIRDGILHDFDPGELRPYMAQFLAGFPAERHYQSVTDGLRANASDKDLLIRNRIKRHSGKSRISMVSYKTHTSGIRYRRILLPVWILHYTYDDKPMKVVTCGLHGRTFGERPFSTGKLLGYAAALSAVAIIVGWVWGASGML